MRAIILVIFICSFALADCKTTLRKYELTNGIDTCKWKNLYKVCESKDGISHQFSNFIFSGKCDSFKKPMRGVKVSEELVKVEAHTKNSAISEYMRSVNNG